MNAKYYAQAIYELTGENTISNLLAVLERKGHKHLLPSILSEYKKLKMERAVAENIQVRVAKKSDLEKNKVEITKDAEKFSLNVSEAEVVEDNTIIGGFILEKGEVEVDKSYKKVLIDLYKKMIKSAI